MSAVRAALLIAGKDLRQRLRDRSLVLMTIVVPLGLSFILGQVFGGIGTPDAARIAVVDEDRGEGAARFVADALRPAERAGAIRVRTAPSPAAGARLADRGEVAAVIVIPAGFSTAVRSGGPVTMRVIGDADSPVGAQVARAVTDAYAAELRAVRLSVAVALRGPPRDADQARELADRAAKVPPPLTVSDVSAVRRQLDMTTYLAAGMAVFFLFFTVQSGVTGLLDERRDGTMARLLAAPVPPAAILAGKLLSSYLTGIVSMGTLAVGTSLALGADWGDPFGVALLVLAGVLSATGVMAFVATFARTSEQAGNWQSITAVVLGLLGGTFFPVAQAGGVIGALSHITPHRWFMRGLADLSGGGGVGVVLPALAAMTGFAVVLGGIAVVRLNRMVRP